MCKLTSSTGARGGSLNPCFIDFPTPCNSSLVSPRVSSASLMMLFVVLKQTPLRTAIDGLREGVGDSSLLTQLNGASQDDPLGASMSSSK